MELRPMKFMFLFLLTTTGLTALNLSLDWSDYKDQFNKTYLDQLEELYRHSIWRENSKKILSHNIEANNGQHRYWMKMNHFGDMAKIDGHSLSGLECERNDCQAYGMIVKLIMFHTVPLPKTIAWVFTCQQWNTVESIVGKGEIAWKTEEINLIMNRLNVTNLDPEPSDTLYYQNENGNQLLEMNQDGGYPDRKSVYSKDDGNVTDGIPDSIDWREKGYVTPVKYQGHCGACYAFSATGALEGQHFRKTGKLVSLSEQNIIDCTAFNRYHDKGCRGGLMDHAFRYVIDAGGIDTESSYPYESDVGRCRFSYQTVGATAKSYKDVLPRGDENKLKEVVGTKGPVSVGIDAHGFGFHFYSHGIYDGWFCSSRKLNHGVLVVGYGNNCGNSGCDGQDYWIVKNSWGRWWGQDGYVKMSRNKENQCGIATLASIPIV